MHQPSVRREGVVDEYCETSICMKVVANDWAFNAHIPLHKLDTGPNSYFAEMKHLTLHLLPVKIEAAA